MKMVNNCLLLNMVVADILFVSTIPVIAYVRIVVNWNFGAVLCGFTPYSQVWTIANRQ